MYIDNTVGGVAIESTRLLGLRPTDYEIDLEARQLAEERGWTYLQSVLWKQGAEWARSIAQYSKPNASLSLPRDERG
jgi:hypothetical protein